MEARMLVCGQCSSGTLITITIPAEEMPPPPGALRAIATDFPEKCAGWRTVCENCGATVAVSYDYGTLDLGLVRDDQLGEDDFEIFS